MSSTNGRLQSRDINDMLVFATYHTYKGSFLCLLFDVMKSKHVKIETEISGCRL